MNAFPSALAASGKSLEMILFLLLSYIRAHKSAPPVDPAITTSRPSRQSQALSVESGCFAWLTIPRRSGYKRIVSREFFRPRPDLSTEAARPGLLDNYKGNRSDIAWRERKRYFSGESCIISPKLMFTSLLHCCAFGQFRIILWPQRWRSQREGEQNIVRGDFDRGTFYRNRMHQLGNFPRSF